MPKERDFNYKTCRYYINGGLWVSRDGMVVGYTKKHEGRWGMQKERFHSLRIHHDDIHQFVERPWKGNISLSKAVITCWCPPAPNDEKTYSINYKDGNPLNCDASNLEWVEYHYKHRTEDSVKLTIGENKVIVFRNGTVKVNGIVASVSDGGSFDADMDLYGPGRAMCVSLSRKGTIHPHMIPVDELMDLAGYVQGDDAGLKTPVVLHKDLDWKNLNSDNLEWVEADDQRYIDYQAKILEARKAISEEVNKGKKVPENWVR